MSSKLPTLLRRFSCICFPRPNSLESNSIASAFFRLLDPSDRGRNLGFPIQIDPSPRSFSTGPANVQGPTAIDYRSLLQKDVFHRLGDNTIHDVQDRFEEYGDEVEIDDFDIDYGNDALTLKLGVFDTYIINKQAPNRQIWLSSPVSGPSRFDWDQESKGWLYRRTGADLLGLLEFEMLNQSIHLSLDNFLRS